MNHIHIHIHLGTKQNLDAGTENSCYLRLRCGGAPLLRCSTLEEGVDGSNHCRQNPYAIWGLLWKEGEKTPGKKIPPRGFSRWYPPPSTSTGGLGGLPQLESLPCPCLETWGEGEYPEKGRRKIYRKLWKINRKLKLCKSAMLVKPCFDFSSI